MPTEMGRRRKVDRMNEPAAGFSRPKASALRVSGFYQAWKQKEFHYCRFALWSIPFWCSISVVARPAAVGFKGDLRIHDLIEEILLALREYLEASAGRSPAQKAGRLRA